MKQYGKKTNKYRNTTLDTSFGKFDSIKEYNYYLLLLDRQKSKEIHSLQRQVTYHLFDSFKYGNDKRIEEGISYISDFTYFDIKKNKTIIIDIKSCITEKDPVYRIKRKLLKKQLKDSFDTIEFQQII